VIDTSTVKRVIDIALPEKARLDMNNLGIDYRYFPMKTVQWNIAIYYGQG